MLEACRRSPTVKQILWVSSDKAYGIHAQLPYRETHPLIGRYPYDVSKSCADLLAQAYAATYALPVVIARCGNIYGGGDLNWNRIVPGTIRAVVRGERPQIRSDGRCLRDYLYVEDCVAAYLLAAERLMADPTLIGEAFNFSPETPLTVLEIVEHIRKLMNRSDLMPDIRNEASHEIPDQYLDSGKARQRLGWRPRYAIEDGLRHTIQWYQTFFEQPKGQPLLAADAHTVLMADGESMS